MYQLLHFYFGNVSLTFIPSSLVPGLQSLMSLFLKCLALVHILMFPSPITRIFLLVFSTWQNPNNPLQSSSNSPWGALADLLLFVLLLVTEPWGSIETPSPKAISKLLAGCCEMKPALISQSRGSSGSKQEQMTSVHFSLARVPFAQKECYMNTGWDRTRHFQTHSSENVLRSFLGTLKGEGTWQDLLQV